VFDLNLPNALTVLRILLVPVLIAALVQEGGGLDGIAAAASHSRRSRTPWTAGSPAGRRT
jgi:phosphatidylglycerophosphate synthase